MRSHQSVAPEATEEQLARLRYCASLAPWSRGLTLLSMWLLAAMVALALLTAPALGGLGDRSVGGFVLLAGLATILAVLTVAVLLADACTQPLVEMARAAQALAHDKSDEADHSYNECDDIAALRRHAPRTRLLAAADWADRPTAVPAIANRNAIVQCRCKLTTGDGVGAYIDIVIPSAP
jgi:hypothetical protein